MVLATLQSLLQRAVQLFFAAFGVLEELVVLSLDGGDIALGTEVLVSEFDRRMLRRTADGPLHLGRDPRDPGQQDVDVLGRFVRQSVVLQFGRKRGDRPVQETLLASDLGYIASLPISPLVTDF